MKTYNNIKEVEKDIKNGVLEVDDDIEIAFNGFTIDADIKCHNIYSKGYRRNINASDINAWDINASDINAWDITARNINAGDISYHAVCFAYQSFKCKSVNGRRGYSKHFCLDSEIEYKEVEETIEIAGHRYSKKEVEEKLKDLKEVK